MASTLKMVSAAGTNTVFVDAGEVQKRNDDYLTWRELKSMAASGRWDVQAGVYNLFADHARLPRDGSFNQYEPTLNYPGTRFLFSLTHRF